MSEQLKTTYAARLAVTEIALHQKQAELRNCQRARDEALASASMAERASHRRASRSCWTGWAIGYAFGVASGWLARGCM